MLYPLLFNPNLHTVVWGGHRLQPYKGLPATNEPIGESWEVSAVPTSVSIISNGELAGGCLNDVVAEYGASLLGNAVVQKYGTEFPLLVKFIDAAGNLSIQVHPNDQLARMRHGKNGKTECWYIIDAVPGASLYAGLKTPISKYEYEKRVADGTICDVLARHEVHPGDVFYLPAGRIHAIGAGILLAEVQQSSDVTYRIFDYNRPGLDGHPRELHTELAVDAIDYAVEDEYRTIYNENADRANHCIDSPFFNVRIVNIEGSATHGFHRNLLKYDSFIISMCIEGDCDIRIRQTGDTVRLTQGNTCLIPACIADYDVFPVNPQGKTRLLDAFIDGRKGNAISNLASKFLHFSVM